MLFRSKQKTAYEVVSGDWSSDVCSSDLLVVARSGKSGTAADKNGRGEHAERDENAPHGHRANYITDGKQAGPVNA